MKRAAAILPVLLRDLAGLAGAVLVAYGTWLAYRPAGFVAGGVLLLAGALRTAAADARPAIADELAARRGHADDE